MTLREDLDQFSEWIQNNQDTELFIDQLDEIERICQNHIKAAVRAEIEAWKNESREADNAHLTYRFSAERLKQLEDK